MKKDKMLTSSGVELEIRQAAKSIVRCQRDIAKRFRELGAHDFKRPSLPVFDFLIKREKQLNQELLAVLDAMQDYTHASPDLLSVFEALDDRFIMLLDVLERCKFLQTIMCQLPLLFKRLEEMVVDQDKAEMLEKKYDNIACAYKNISAKQIESKNFTEEIENFEYQMRSVVRKIVSVFIMYYQKSINIWYQRNLAAGYEVLINNHYGLLLKMLGEIEVVPEGLVNLKQQFRSLDRNLKFSVEDLKKSAKFKLAALGDSIDIHYVSALLSKYQMIYPIKPNQSNAARHGRDFGI